MNGAVFVADKMKIGAPKRDASDGSMKPSPQVARMVSCSSNGCQRMPILGTRTLVSLFLKSSKRPEALNSSEYAPGIFILGLVIGICVSAKIPYALRPPKLGLAMPTP